MEKSHSHGRKNRQRRLNKLGQLDFMRSNQPPSFQSNRTARNAPPPDYEHPTPDGGSADVYYTEQIKPENAVGFARRQAVPTPDPTNPGQATGKQSVNLGSQNFSFTAPVLSLAGRGGLNLELTLTYNSKVWNKEGNKIFFNNDKGFPAPGWRLGFGVIQGKDNAGMTGPYVNQTTGKLSYVYLTPDGTRRDLFFDSVSSRYLSYDSSYIEFQDSVVAEQRILYLPNGTRIRFGENFDHQYHPTEIKDRHGNKISIYYQTLPNNSRAIDRVIDTLGRTFNFVYENNYLMKIRQCRAGQCSEGSTEGWHNYIELSYTEVNVSTAFEGLTTDPSPVGSVWLPSEVVYPTGHSYRFYYTSYAQLYLIEKWVPGGGEQYPPECVAYTHYNLPSEGAIYFPVDELSAVDPASGRAQTDSPSFTKRREWGKYWNNGKVAVYQYFFPAAENYSTVTDPLGRVYHSESTSISIYTVRTSRFYASAVAYRNRAGTPLKTSTMTYQKNDDQSVGDNWRLIEAKIEDDVSAKRTAYGYTDDKVKLVNDVIEYKGATDEVYRHTTTIYNEDPGYAARNIFGLPEEISVYRGAGTTNLIARSKFTHDDPDLYLDSSEDLDPEGLPIPQYDKNDDNGNPFTKRGNVSRVTQFSVSDGNVGESRDLSRTFHDSQGNVRQTIDAIGNVTTYDPQDNFVNKPAGIGDTRATVQAVTDPKGFKNGAKYDWNTGLTVESYHIDADGGSAKNIVAYEYDYADRLGAIQRPDGGGMRRDYWDNWMATAEFVKIDETKTRYSFTAYDGAGQVRWSGSDLPDEQSGETESSGKYRIRTFEYDDVGRAISISNMTAVDGDYFPVDDDDPAQGGYGYLYTTIEYDALDRQKLVTHPESNTLEYEYTGCDCAGGLSVTVRDERLKKRKQDYDYDYGQYGERLWMQEKDSDNKGAGRTDYVYDQYSRLQSETRKFGEWTDLFKVDYSYNLVDALTQVKYTAKGWIRQVNYGYNYAGEPWRVGTDLIENDPTSNLMSQFVYRGFGGLKSANYGNGRRVEINYSHHRNHMTALLVKNQNGSDPILDLGYDYYNGGGSNGRVQKITNNRDSNYTTTYEYDDYNRLEKAYCVNFYRDYDFDAWGNLWKVNAGGGGETGGYELSYEYLGGVPKTNRILSVNGGPPLDYDLAGNLTKDGSLVYGYDAAHRLTTASGYNSGYEYDGDGRRVKQVNDGGKIYYLWSSVLGEPVVELDEEGGVYRAYVYSPGGQRLGLQSFDDGFYWLHTDHLGNCRRMTDKTGAKVYEAEYDPHGQIIEEWSSDGQLYKNSHKFTGYERDWATGLDNAKARTYMHNRGRFMQPDPLGIAGADLTNPQSLNRYTFVGNDPVNFVDPSGLNRINVEVECDRQVCSSGGCTTYCTLKVSIFWDDYSSGGNGGESSIWDSGGSGQGGQEQGVTQLTIDKFKDCLEKYRFSSAVGTVLGDRAQNIVRSIEIGSEISLAADVGASIYKASKIGLGGPKQMYASGFNYVFRQLAETLSNEIGGKQLVTKGGVLKVLRPIGDKLTPALAVTGAFTGGYNLSIAAQCIGGLLK